MASKKGELPNLLFVSPIGCGRHKAKHSHVVFLVEEWDENGVPKRMRLCGMDEVFDLEDVNNRGQEFMTGYIQSHMLEHHLDRANKKAT